MAKMFFSLGFWMTIMLFVVLGYAFSAIGSECRGSINYAEERATFGSSMLSTETWLFENNSRGSDVASIARCPNTVLRGNDPDLQQMANLQVGAPTYAPGLALTITHRPPEVSLCPGPIEIPRH
jgi:hypothetical protein